MVSIVSDSRGDDALPRQGFFCSPQVSASNSPMRAAINRLPRLSSLASRR
jgi:hypothetical protein